MVELKLSIEDENNLMVITVEGELTSSEIIKFASQTFIEKNLPNILWDISNGSVSNISENEVRSVAQEIKAFRKVQSFGKTALVSNSESDYGILRMYEVQASAKNPTIEYAVFKDLKEARRWILAN